MIHALGQILSLLLGLGHLLCLDFLRVGPDLFLLYRYLNFLLRSSMMYILVIMRMQVTANNHDAYGLMQVNKHG
jgi:hypothetical protein